MYKFPRRRLGDRVAGYERVDSVNFGEGAGIYGAEYGVPSWAGI
jgi:hypothetical protein